MALIWAAGVGESAVVEQLVAAGADPNRQGEEGATALMKAAGEGHSAIVAQLVAAGGRGEPAGRGGRDGANEGRG